MFTTSYVVQFQVKKAKRKKRNERQTDWWRDEHTIIEDELLSGLDIPERAHAVECTAAAAVRLYIRIDVLVIRKPTNPKARRPERRNTQLSLAIRPRIHNKVRHHLSSWWGQIPQLGRVEAECAWLGVCARFSWSESKGVDAFRYSARCNHPNPVPAKRVLT